jgi:hypothetical protein
MRASLGVRGVSLRAKQEGEGRMVLVRKSILAAALVVLVCNCSRVRSRSQPTVSGGTVVTGTVLDSAGTRPVHPSRVDLLGSALYTLGDSLGQFVLSSVPQGRHVLTVRGIGFLVADVPIVARGDSVRLPAIRLRPSHRLDSLNLIAP